MRVAVLAVLLAAAVLLGATAALECLHRNKTVATRPSGDIPVLLGRPLDIYCYIEPGLGFDASRMRFLEVRAGGAVSHEADTRVLNATAAHLHIARPPAQSSTYYCEAAGEAPRHSCHNTVVVDGPPRPPRVFRCRSADFDYLECSWRPDKQFAHTQYTLFYLIQGEPTPPCSVRFDRQNANPYSCRWNLSTVPIYRQQEKEYAFNLTAVNRFGVYSQNFTIDHLAVLVPRKPTNLTKRETAHGVLLQWQVSQNMASYSKGIVHRIAYQIKNIDDVTTWRNVSVEAIIVDNKTFRFNLTNLPYANTQYDVRVSIRSARAPNDEEFWSEPEGTTFFTLSERPPRPPRTQVGAFHSDKRIQNMRDVYVYWQQIETYEQSGKNFTYNVIAKTGIDNVITIRPQIIASSFAYFPNTTLDSFNVSIASYNVQGNSVNKSYVYVPSDSALLVDRRPFGFTKTVYGNKTYDLRWQPPKDTSFEFDSYTVFWCLNTVETVDKCTGKLNFTILPPEKDNFRIEVEQDKMYLFAISANSGPISSGMVWGTCKVPAEKATNKVTFFKRDEQRSRYVTLRWGLECSFKEGDIKGYNITYCPVIKKIVDCNKEKYLIIKDPNLNSINFTGLEPHKTYSFQIAVIYKDGTGDKSEPVDATTLEDKPSRPLNLTLSNINSNSMIVSWYPPEIKNGFIVKYIVNYSIDSVPNSSKQWVMKISIPTIDDEVEENRKRDIELTGLHAFTNYTVSVAACTTIDACSEPSEEAAVRTAIGVPERLKQPNLNETNLQWTSPNIPGGLVEYYEVEIFLNNELFKTYKTRNLEHIVPLCSDVSDNDNYRLTYRVRAVNIDNDVDHGIMPIKGTVNFVRAPESWNGSQYEGEWSEFAVMHCGKNSSAILFWTLGMIFFALIVIVTVLGSRKIWYRYKTMTDIDPVLPPGFGPIVEKESSKYPLSQGWSQPSKTKEEKPFLPTTDKVLLLPNITSSSNKKDFSGSSENTDSTTLSLTSKDLVDQDALTSDEGSNNSSLRLRNTPTKSATPVVRNVNGYVGWSNKPTAPQYDNDDPGDDHSMVSDDLSEPTLPPGYVQTAPLPVMQPEIINRNPPRNGIPTGYVCADEAMKPPVSFPASGLPPKITVLPDNELLPKFLSIVSETKPIIEQRIMRPHSADNIKLAVRSPPVKPPVSSGYVSHENAVINKHLNILSNNHLIEEPAIPDPNMSPEAYCRFAWDTDTATNNLESLLSEQRDHCLATEAAKD